MRTLPLADLELRWPPHLFATESDALTASDASGSGWQERAEHLLEEAFTGTAVRDHLARIATEATLAGSSWGSRTEEPATTPVRCRSTHPRLMRWSARRRS